MGFTWPDTKKESNLQLVSPMPKLLMPLGMCMPHEVHLQLCSTVLQGKSLILSEEARSVNLCLCPLQFQDLLLVHVAL